MKVKELIEQLEKLDGDKDIYVFYDYYARIEPEVETDNEGNYFFGAS